MDNTLDVQKLSSALSIVFRLEELADFSDVSGNLDSSVRRC